MPATAMSEQCFTTPVRPGRKEPESSLKEATVKRECVTSLRNIKRELQTTPSPTKEEQCAMGPAVKKFKLDLGTLPPFEQFGGSDAITGLRGLLRRGELCDVELLSCGRSFPAHRVVLAASSPSFREALTSGIIMRSPSCPTLPLSGLSSGEAVEIMLASVYGEDEGCTAKYNPTSLEVNTDVLRLARQFQLPNLREQAEWWLSSQNITTANAVQHLVICDEFGLSALREGILEQIAINADALYLLAGDPMAVNTPEVLRDLIVRVLRLLTGPSGRLQWPTPRRAAGRAEGTSSSEGSSSSQGSTSSQSTTSQSSQADLARPMRRRSGAGSGHKA
eukprot:gnl/TRDRNA2_/TRDRNA2_194226_c0_seq1.p1 gnl/TRDRNA2_/TRDRNA2_194226_c0~~gnl/TRDRNA2_/TRDRNA2_194226_c0_seq1.p1  ORF type:complete len:354 (-),score=73.87 gnl/TRDRNA2_/TRDRNA2_194226_c0_seq1:103-1107(-)